MSEAELHILRARLLGGIRNKAARGELRRSVPEPVGFVWGDEDGEIRFDPNEAVCAAVQLCLPVSASSVRRAGFGCGCHLPMRRHYGHEMQWIAPSYIAIYPCSQESGLRWCAYTYGKTRRGVVLDASVTRKRRLHRLPRSQWAVFIPNHDDGYIDWTTYEANRARVATTPTRVRISRAVAP
jgi:hypothetical protein